MAFVLAVQAASFWHTSPAEAAVTLIDFELASHPAAIDGTDASTLYESRGVTFATHPSILEEPEFAHSGVQVLRNLAPGTEFGGDHLLIDFDPACDVRSVAFFAGLDRFATPGPITMTAAASALVEVSPGVFVPVVVASQTEVVDGPGPTPISTSFLLSQPDKEGPPITRATISYSGINTVVIDDLTFDTAGECRFTEPVPPPTLRFEAPTEGQTYETVRPFGGLTRAALVNFRVDVEASAHISRVRIVEAGPSGTREYDACGSVDPCPSIRPDFDFELNWTIDFTQPGEYQVSALAIDDLGGSGWTAVNFSIVVYQLHDVEINITGTPSVRRPEVRDFQIQILVPDIRTLEAVALTMDDTSLRTFASTEDTRFVLIGPGAVSDEIRLEPLPSIPHHLMYRIRFPLPMWQVGTNAIRLEVVTSGEDGSSTHTRTAIFEYRLPTSNFGIEIGPDGRLGTRYRPTGISIWATGCPFVFCKDADQDGLLDLWENVAVEVLHPWLQLGEADGLFDHPTHHVRLFTRVIPVAAESCPTIATHVLFVSSVAFSADYGVLGIESHNGDTEEFDALWAIDDASAVSLDRIWTKGHPWGIDPPREYEWGAGSTSLDALGRPSIAVELDKHGTWSDLATCLRYSRYPCIGVYTRLRPPAVNAGEPPADATGCDPLRPLPGRRFIESLSHVQMLPHPDFVGIFPGDYVWGARYGGVFCGGLRWEPSCATAIGIQLRTRMHGLARVPDDDPALVTRGSLGP